MNLRVENYRKIVQRTGCVSCVLSGQEELQYTVDVSEQKGFFLSHI